MVELRRFTRAPIHQQIEFSSKDGPDNERIEGVARDISVGGMFIESSFPAAFGQEVRIHIRLPGAKDEMTLPGVVRWTRPGGMGVQFGLLGARETHAITEIVKKAEA